MKHINKLLAVMAFGIAASLSVPALADGGDKVHTEKQDVKSSPVVDHSTNVAPAPAPVAAQPTTVLEPVVIHESTPAVEHHDAVVDHSSDSLKLDEPVVGSSATTTKHNYWNFKRFGLGAGGSFAARDQKQLFKLDFNAGPLYVAYYANSDYHRNVLGALAPEIPVFNHDKHPVSVIPAGGVQYNGNNAFVKMNVVAFAHVDVGLFKQFHLRAGPTFFIPTNAGDTTGVNSDVRRDAAKHPRGDVVVRYAF
jgi:hypothetical protein